MAITISYYDLEKTVQIKLRSVIVDRTETQCLTALHFSALHINSHSSVISTNQGRSLDSNLLPFSKPFSPNSFLFQFLRPNSSIIKNNFFAQILPLSKTISSFFITKTINISMIRRKSLTRFVFFTFTLFLLLSFAAFLSSAEDSPTENDDEFEELVAIDEQGDEGDELQHGEQQKEAEVLSRAQRIVLELNFESAKRVISENELVMILGYAPWCPRSAELMPQFAEAANKLKELGSPLLMAKLDAERYPKAASMLDIKGFPTLLLFVNGTSQVYTGGFSAEDIVIWTRKKTGVPVIRVRSVPEAEELLKKYQTFVLGLFEKFEGRDYDEFLKAAVSDNEIQFLETNDLAVAKVLYPDIKSTDFLGIVKSEPERYTGYEGTFETPKILQFLDHNKFPLVIRLTDLNSGRVYSSPIKLQVMIFAEPGEYKTVVEALQEVAKRFKTKIMFIYVDINDEDIAKPFLTLFGLEDSQDTVVIAFDNQISSKYLLESDPTASNIEDFCSKLLQGSQSPYYKSQPVPDNTNATVHVVVGKTFDELVLNNPKNVFLEVFTPWCINCETTSKKVEKLAKHFKGLDSLVFAKFDASVNEHPKLQVEDYPRLLLYLAGDKTNPIKLSTKSSSKELAAAINKHLKAKEQTAKDEL